MDLKSGYPLWLVQSGLPYTYPKLDQDIKTDVLILGGGISGALIAHYLIKNNIDCRLVDGRTIGLGSTCASTSLLQYQIDTPLEELIDKVGRREAIRAYKLCAWSVEALEKTARTIGFNNFERKKTLFYASYKKDAAFIKREYQLHKGAGFSVEYWDEELIKNRFGFYSPAALFSNHSAQTDAYGFTNALLQYNIPKGLKVYDRTRVIGIRHSKTRINLQTESGHRIIAKKIVYATGYESVKYIPKKVVKLESTFALASEQFKEDKHWFNNCLLWETKKPYLYMRSTRDNRLVVGGRDEPFYNPAKRDALLKRKSRLLEKDFKNIFPHLAFTAEFTWAGTFGSTQDGLPYIGYFPGIQHALFALGFGGNGITFSLIAARIIADLIKGKVNRDLNLYSFQRNSTH